MHATPQNKTVFFLQFVCSSLEMHQPTFWLYQLLEKHCVDSIAGETLCGLYPYIYSYIYTQYIYMYMYMYMLTPPIPTLKHFLGRIYVVIFVY